MLVFLLSIRTPGWNIYPGSECVTKDTYDSELLWRDNCNIFRYREEHIYTNQTYMNALRSSNNDIYLQHFRPAWDMGNDSPTVDWVSLEISDTPLTRLSDPAQPYRCSDPIHNYIYYAPPIIGNQTEELIGNCPFYEGKKTCCPHMSTHSVYTHQFSNFLNNMQHKIYPRCFNLLRFYGCTMCHPNISRMMIINSDATKRIGGIDIPLIGTFRMCNKYAEAVYRECRNVFWTTSNRIVPKGMSLENWKLLNGIELDDDGNVVYENINNTCIEYSSGYINSSVSFSLLALIFLVSTCLNLFIA